MSSPAIENFKSYFIEMDLNNPSALDEIYAPEIVFKDPIHEIKGLDQLKEYFGKLNQNLVEGSFHFTDESMVDDKAYLSWTMDLELKRPRKRVEASGISVLHVRDKIISQRDYFDAGELFYEQVPILGGIIRMLKKKIALG